jgi:hypothetical protein
VQLFGALEQIFHCLVLLTDPEHDDDTDLLAMESQQDWLKPQF